jgi:hypothetical protein
MPPFAGDLTDTDVGHAREVVVSRPVGHCLINGRCHRAPGTVEQGSIHQGLGERIAREEIQTLALLRDPAEEGLHHRQAVAAAILELRPPFKGVRADLGLDAAERPDHL